MGYMYNRSADENDSCSAEEKGNGEHDERKG